MARKNYQLLPGDILEITERVATGERLIAVLKNLRINPFDFFKHLDKVPEDKLLFEQARKVAIEVLVDETNSLYDNIGSKLDLEIAKAKAGQRQWMAEKIIPATYGTKIQHDVSGTINIKAALGEANARVLRVVDNLSTSPPEPATRLLPDLEAAFSKVNELPSDRKSGNIETAQGLLDSGENSEPTINPEDLF